MTITAVRKIKIISGITDAKTQINTNELLTCKNSVNVQNKFMDTLSRFREELDHYVLYPFHSKRWKSRLFSLVVE